MSDIEENKIAVIGAGSWGTALAVLLSSKGLDVRLWGHLPEEIRKLSHDRENSQFLPGIPFPASLRPVENINLALSGVQDVLIAVPSHAFRIVAQTLSNLLEPRVGIFWATKGFEPGTQRLMSEISEELHPTRNLAVISGPTFAREVACGLPTAITVASNNNDYAGYLAELLHTTHFRAYTSPDLIGVQVGGASKNVLAIAAGIADGLGFGANTRAALITRGLHEIMQLGLKLGGKAETFMGLAGLGDLVLTCTDDQSRNRRMGLALSKGVSINKAKADIGQEVEGLQTTKEVHLLATRLGVEMPISEQVHAVLYEGLDPKTAVINLLERSQRAEIY